MLQGRAGYRDILVSFLLAEAAATIAWEDGDRLFSAGQRNVAELYEYWVFLELVRIIESLPGFEADKRNLVRRTADGPSLELCCDRQSSLCTATGERRGTGVAIRLWFNKSFPGAPRMQADELDRTDAPRLLDADSAQGPRPQRRHWIHFDAKYRVHELSEALDDDRSEARLGGDPRRQRPISGDLAKMHAYRDAIRRTAGAYVSTRDETVSPRFVTPSTTRSCLALARLPSVQLTTGNLLRTSSSVLAAFLDDVIDHVAAQGTAAERARYWTTRSYTPAVRRRLDHDELLSKPPADTTVLLGFVKSAEHLAWVLATGWYNLRADVDRAGAVGVEAPELTPDFVLLYNVARGRGDTVESPRWCFCPVG